MIAVAITEREPLAAAPTVTSDAAPERRCLATGEVKPIAALVRFVVWPDSVGAGSGELVPDVDRRLGGRGLWITARRDIMTAAAARNLFAKAARMDVRVAPDLADRVEALLLRRIVAHIGLARRAGGAVCGMERVRDWLAQGRVSVRLTASDGGSEGRRKLQALVRETPHVTVLTATELGRAFGRDWVVHAALAAGRLGEEVGDEAGRLAGFRDGGRTAEASGTTK